MKPITIVLLISLGVIIAGLALWLAFLKQDVTVSAARQQTLRDAAAPKDVIIFFNSGGWGNTPLEDATDFTPVLDGIEDSLGQLGYSSVIVPFVRTQHDIARKVEDVKEYFNSFKYSSQAQANEVAYILSAFPGKRVIIAGFSNGGGLTLGTMELGRDNPNVYAIVAGAPRWYLNDTSSRILVLDNNGKDRLSSGNIAALTVAVIKAPFKWLSAKIHHQPLNFARAVEIPGHEYLWTSGEVRTPIVDFLTTNFSLHR